MASDPPLTVQALDECLKELVDWEMVATYLPEMTQADIEFIKKDNPGNTGIQKLALYNKWLHLYPHGTWENVIKALEKVKENRLAQIVLHKMDIRKRESRDINKEKLTEQIDESVVTELRRLHKTFERLEKDVEKRCNELVASKELSLSDLSRPFTRPQNIYKINSSLNSIQTTSEFFESLGSHYTYLDCDLLERIVEDLSDSTNLQSKIQDYKKSIMSFKRETPIRNLKNKLKPYIRQAHLSEISLMVIFELEEAWGEVDMSLFETLVETMFPGLSKEMKWYKVVPGSLCVTFTAPVDYEEALISLTKEKLSFIRLMGIVRVAINGKDILQEREDETYSFETALLKASSIGNIEAVAFLLYEIQVSVTHLDENNQNALMIAIENNHIEIVQLLLNAKVNPNHQRNDGNTPLHIACYKGYTQLAIMLLDFGADPAITNEKGQTPILSAIRGKMLEVVIMIARKLPKHQIPSAILLSCRLGYSDIISFLLQCIDPPCSTIHLHCANGELPLVAEHAVHFSEDVNSTLVLGITPLMIASSCGHVDVVDCLVQANANINCVDQDGYSPLAYAITGSNSLPVIECLLEAGANPSITVGGISLLQLAKQSDNGDLMDLLLRYMALHLYNMFSSLVEKIQRNMTSEIDSQKITLQDIKNKLLNDPEFSHIESIAKVSSCSELFISLQPHYDFLSWKVISFLSNILKQEGYFKLVEIFESQLQIAVFPSSLSLCVPKQQPNTLSSLNCSELSISLGKQWATKSLGNLRELITILFSSLARLMSHVTVCVTQQEIIVMYKIPKSIKLAGRIRTVCSAKYDPALVLGIIRIALDSEPVLMIGQNLDYSFEKAFVRASAITSVPSKDVLKLVKFLLKVNNTDPNYNDSSTGITALQNACRAGNIQVVDYILSLGAEPDLRDIAEGCTPLMATSSRGQFDMVKVLVSKCPSAVNTADSYGATPIVYASYKGHTEIVKFLLSNGAQPNLGNRNGTTALLIAARYDYIEVVRILLEAGADLNTTDKRGNSPLMIASVYGYNHIVKLLLDYKADYQHSVIDQGIPTDSFGAACSSGNIDTVRVFQDNISNHSSVSISRGWYIACLLNHAHLISELVHSLPQFSMAQRELVLACVNNDLATISNNLRYPDIEFVHGVTLLMIACSCDRTGIVKALINAGASTIKEDEFKNKAIDFCKKNSSILAMILQTGDEPTKGTFDKEAFLNILDNSSGSLKKGLPNVRADFEQSTSYVL